jgi:type IV fimbrial biogenesis protein FimT
MKQVSGISLVEILIVLSLLGILLSQFDLSGFSRAKEVKAIDGVMTDIVSAVSMARLAAVNEARMVTFCRSNDGHHCQGKWHEGSIIFTDTNADRVMNEDDRLLFRLQAIPAIGELKFNSFRNRQYLQMTPRGMTNYQNGNFTFCPADGNSVLARQIIVSLTGRTRHARDTDGDGIVENSRGQPLNCD